MKKFLIISIFGILLRVNAQSAYAPLNTDYQHLIDRIEIKSTKLSSSLFTGFKPYQRVDIVSLVDSSTNMMSKVDRFNLQYLKADNWEFDTSDVSNSKRSIFKHFYQKQNGLYTVNNKDFSLIVNPVFHFNAGKESNSNTNLQYLNTRGVEIRGIIDNKIGFYTFFTDNQFVYPKYVKQGLPDSVPLMMGENYTKNTSPSKVDFISARGYLTFNVSKHVAVQFGHDKNFVGNGFRSLILSDHSGTYNFLKLNTKIWKFQYTNLFCQLTAAPQVSDGVYPKKYFALHHLSLNIGKKLNIGIFESIMFGRQDGNFDFNYLNPIIFYRSAEQNVGSNDNAFLGMDWKYNIARHLSWYGQIVLDEFIMKQFRARKGNWVNKQGFQMGLKYIDVLNIKNLDLQGEINVVRPYMYAHKDLARSYSHYLQPLAHPRGANFTELIGIARFQPLNRLAFTGKMIFVKQGVDSVNSSKTVGANVLKDYTNRPYPSGQIGNDDNHRLGQGVSTNLVFLEFCTTYQAKHNIFIDLLFRVRNQKSDNVNFQYDSQYVGLAFRCNIAKRNFDY